MKESFHNTYNARHLAPSDVAKTFIYSNNFQRLVQNNHSIILGARGCGKTTLMKMLTIPALYSWENDPLSSNIRSTIPFYGIYVSTDIYWNVKNQTYGAQLERYGNFADRISHFSVNSNVFISLCDTFINIISTEINDYDERKEVELSVALIKAWKLDYVVPKIKFIREALNERIDTVNQFIQDVIFNFKPEDEIPYPDFFNLAFESSLELIIPKFERIYNIEGVKKWALCFDELEFAPIWLQEKLFASLRSRTQYILYKLSASPILPSKIEKLFKGEYSPTSGNDVDMIKMWASADSEDFSKKIINSFLGGDLDVKEVLGSNEIYNKSQNSYVKGSAFHKKLLNLIDKDESFMLFLKDKRVDLVNPVPLLKGQKDTLFRKIKPIVYFREFFLLSNINKHPKYRSRKKSIDLFHGYEVISKVCDGNPRWLIGIISQLISKRNEIDSKISKEDQYNELLNASKRFKNVIANIPVGNSNVNMVKIIDRIGEYFKNEILGGDFKMDPRGTFIVDEDERKVHESLIELINKGVSQGAFILLDSNDNSFDFEVRGKRFKLSYLFYILYNLPLRSYNPVKLSDCLEENDSTKQVSLFN
ncbi:hypothetical protein [Tenacibaculum sp. 47A_GOM-205m]|uniref:ORC-CDC6 family AAA ATPase n=1 Tax=Tenacibaculum sp. 47A_GOM-205m TaxID=1380384 RepID=UPI00048CF5B1|nr:hypothetical protein [Tenacibaculum sp. 47A_GOM-205m]